MIGDGVKVTHLPSGEAVTVLYDPSNRRSQYRLKAACIEILRSRLYAQKLGLGRSDEVVYSYASEESYSNELMEVRK